MDVGRFHATLSEMVEAINQLNHRVDLIITREDDPAPAGSPMPHFQRAMRIMPRNVELVILMNTNTFARALVSMFSRIFASRQHAQLVIVSWTKHGRALPPTAPAMNNGAKKAS